MVQVRIVLLRLALSFLPDLLRLIFFFIASGYLVTASLLNRQSFLDFIWARVLRIYPALLVMLLLTVAGLSLLSSLSAADYFKASEIYSYLFYNSSLVFGLKYGLPGVFTHNPFPDVVNGSLWTMFYEVRMYIFSAAFWLVLRIAPRYRLNLFRIGLLILTAMIFLFILRNFMLKGVTGHAGRLAWMYCAGASFYILRDYVHLSFWVFASAVIALAAAFSYKIPFGILYVLLLPYCLLYVAYVPGGLIRHYNKLGDYSYGLYIFAFPIQQALIQLRPGTSFIGMIIFSGIITLALAAVSWHLLEQHALKLKVASVHHTRRILRWPILRIQSEKQAAELP